MSRGQWICFISDIHGNLKALDAVLDEIQEENVSSIYVAGDLFLGGDESLAVWRRLQEVKAQCVRGVSDQALTSLDMGAIKAQDKTEQACLDRFVTTREALGDLVLSQIRKLPEQMRIPLVNGLEILMSHGAPSNPMVELTHDMSDEEMLELIADDPAQIIVCGASHVPFERSLSSVHVINVGSVGAAPEGTIAHFTLLYPAVDGVEVKQQWIDYSAA